MERLDFLENSQYLAAEGAQHMNRYLFAKEICKDKVVLDIACGQGYGTKLLSDWGASKVIGVDISTEAIEAAKKLFQKDNLEYYCHNAQELEFIQDKSVDIIISFETIEHIEKDKLFLRELSRLIKDDGIIMISCPNDWWFFPSPNDKNPYHLRKYHLEDFLNITRDVLGKESGVFLGNPVEGFANIYIENQSDAEGQSKMLKYRTAQSFIIPGTEEISGKNASYFIALWIKGPQKNLFSESTVVYPSVFYPNGSETELKGMLCDAKREIKELRADYSSMSKDANEKIVKINQEYQSMLKEIESQIKNIQYEKEKLYEENEEKDIQIDKLELQVKDYNIMIEKLKSCDTQIKQLKDKVKKYKFNFDSLREQNSELRAELKNNKDCIEEYRNKNEKLQKKVEYNISVINEIYSSKCWKVVRKYYNFCDRLKRKKTNE